MRHQLLLGVSREDITPKVGCQLYGYNPTIFSTSVADNLDVTAFVYRYGDEASAMISVCVAGIQGDLSDKIRRLVSESCDIPFDNIMLSSTHTHSGPNVSGSAGWGDMDMEYCDGVFIPRIVKAAKTANENLIPVRVGIATGESLVGINRRNLLDSEDTIFGQNFWGPFDPKKTVIAFRDFNGNPGANIVHYGAHPTAAGANTEITRDWPGVMVDRLEYVSGATTAFFNGCEGDIGPRNTCGCTGGKGSMDWVYEVGYIAASDAVRIYKTIPDFKDLDMEAKSEVLKLKLKPRESLEEAKEKLESLSQERINLNGKKIEHYEKVIASYSNGYEEKEFYDMPQTLIRLGNYVFAALPFEMFSEVGLRINQSCPDKVILSLAMTNSSGGYGYFATESQLCHGGYEAEYFQIARIQAFEKHADTNVVKETLRNISTLKGSETGVGKGWFNKKL